MGDRIASAKGRLLNAHRFHPDQIEDLRRDLAEAKINDYVEKVLAAAPPLSDDQKNRLCELLRHVHRDGGVDG